MPPPRALDIAHQILEALAAAHAVGVVHRDVKPSNVLLVRDARRADFVKLIDFGVAKPAEGSVVSTTTGALVGTPAYMAPEQLRGERATTRSDLHAVGVCMVQPPDDEAARVRAEEVGWSAMGDLGGVSDRFAPASPTDCFCAYDGVGPVLCAEPQVPRCGCITGSGYACPEQPSSPHRCAVGRETYGGEGKRTGTPCTGWATSLDGTAKKVDGVLDCDVCYTAVARSGTAGAACRGLSSQGLRHDGKLVCGTRAKTQAESSRVGPPVGSAATKAASQL